LHSASVSAVFPDPTAADADAQRHDLNSREYCVSWRDGKHRQPWREVRPALFVERALGDRFQALAEREQDLLPRRLSQGTGLQRRHHLVFEPGPQVCDQRVARRVCASAHAQAHRQSGTPAARSARRWPYRRAASPASAHLQRLGAQFAVSRLRRRSSLRSWRRLSDQPLQHGNSMRAIESSSTSPIHALRGTLHRTSRLDRGFQPLRIAVGADREGRAGELQEAGETH
jgi:hypothetical protein